MKILVLGAKGFIGSNCVSHFTGLGHEVVGCDIATGDETNYISLPSLNGNFNKLFADLKFDLCINAAGSANVNYSYEFPQKDHELNVTMVVDLLNAIKINSPNCKFINFSSAAVYGDPKNLPINEKEKLAPLSPYGKHKLESENILKEYHERAGLRTCSLRVFSAYGPGLHKQLFWDIFLRTKNNNRIQLFGTGNESRDFIFIDDLVLAIQCIIDHALFTGERINVASGVESSIKDAAQLFLQALGGNYQLEFSGEEKKGDPANWKADISLLRSFGFEPRFSLAEGLALTAEEYLKH